MLLTNLIRCWKSTVIFFLVRIFPPDKSWGVNAKEGLLTFRFLSKWGLVEQVGHDTTSYSETPTCTL